jgi:hypothetical protein
MDVCTNWCTAQGLGLLFEKDVSYFVVFFSKPHQDMDITNVANMPFFIGATFFTRNMISSILYHLSLRLSLSESGHMPSAPGTRGSAKNTRNILACISDNVENEIHNILACQHNQISMFASAFMLSFEKMNTPSILYISHPVLPISEKLPQLHHYMILQ